MQYLQLVSALANVNGSSFVGIDTLTEVKLTGGKKNPMQGRVTKSVVGSSVMVFQNKTTNGYENMVHRRMVKEGLDPANFELGQRAWGERIAGTPFVQHEKAGAVKYYLEVIFLHAGVVSYYLDGVGIDIGDIQGMPEAVDSVGQGGQEHQVIIRSYAVDSITCVRIDGHELK